MKKEFNQRDDPNPHHCYCNLLLLHPSIDPLFFGPERFSTQEVVAVLVVGVVSILRAVVVALVAVVVAGVVEVAAVVAPVAAVVDLVVGQQAVQGDFALQVFGLRLLWGVDRSCVWVTEFVLSRPIIK